MLLKILVLAVIAWFVLRAARNLLHAVARDQTNTGQPNTRRTTSGTRSHDQTSRGGSESAGPTVIHRPRQSEEPRRPGDEENIEDARFRDL